MYVKPAFSLLRNQHRELGGGAIFEKARGCRDRTADRADVADAGPFFFSKKFSSAGYPEGKRIFSGSMPRSGKGRAAGIGTLFIVPLYERLSCVL